MTIPELIGLLVAIAALITAATPFIRELRATFRRRRQRRGLRQPQRFRASAPRRPRAQPQPIGSDVREGAFGDRCLRRLGGGLGHLVSYGVMPRRRIAALARRQAAAVALSRARLVTAADVVS